MLCGYNNTKALQLSNSNNNNNINNNNNNNGDNIISSKGICHNNNIINKQCHNVVYCLEGYCDASWASDRDDARSTTGWITLLNGNPISWCSRKQVTAAASTAEAEYMAMHELVKEMIWLKQLCEEMHIPITMPMHIKCDNQAAIKIAENNNDVFHDRTKHIQHLKEYIMEMEVKVI